MKKCLDTIEIKLGKRTQRRGFRKNRDNSPGIRQIGISEIEIRDKMEIFVKNQILQTSF